MDSSTGASPSQPRRGTVAAMRQRYSSSPTTAEPPRRKPLMIPKPHHPVPINHFAPINKEIASVKPSTEAVLVTDVPAPISSVDTPNQFPPATEEMRTVSSSELEDKEAAVNPVTVYLNVATANIPRSNSWNGPLSPPSRKHRSPRHHLRNVAPTRPSDEPADAAISSVISTESEPMADHSARSTDSSSMDTGPIEQEEKVVAGPVPVAPPVPRTARLSSVKVRRSRSVSVPRRVPQSEPAVVEVAVANRIPVGDRVLPDPHPPATSADCSAHTMEAETKTETLPAVRASLPAFPRNTNLKHWSRRQQHSKTGKSSAVADKDASVVSGIPHPSVVNVSNTGDVESASEAPGSLSRPAAGGVDVVDILASKRAWMLSRSAKPNRMETRPRTMSEPNVSANTAPSEKNAETLPPTVTVSQKVNPIKAEIDFKAGKRALLALQKAKMSSHPAHLSELTPNVSTVAPIVAVVTNEKRDLPDSSTVRPLHKVNPLVALEAKATAGPSSVMKAADPKSSSFENVPTPLTRIPTKVKTVSRTEKRALSALQIKASKKSSTSPAKIDKPVGRSSSVPSQRPPPLVIERTVPPPKNSAAHRAYVESSSKMVAAIPTSEISLPVVDHGVISLSWSLADKRNKAKQLISSRRSWGGTSMASNLQDSVEGTISARPSSDNVICTSSSSFDTTLSLNVEQPPATATNTFGISLMNTTKNTSRDEISMHSACANTMSTASISTDISGGPIESYGSNPGGTMSQDLSPSEKLPSPKIDATGIEQTLQSHISMMDSDVRVNTPSHSVLYDDSGEVVYMSPNRIGIPLEDKTSALRADSPVEVDDIKDDDSSIDTLVDDIRATRRSDKTEVLRSSSPLMESVSISQKVEAIVQVQPLVVDTSFDFRPIQDDLTKDVTAIVESSWDTTKVLFSEFERVTEVSNSCQNVSADPLAMILSNEHSISTSEVPQIDVSIAPLVQSSTSNDFDAILDPLGWPVKPDGLVTHPVQADPFGDEENVESDDDAENLLPLMKSPSTEEDDDCDVQLIEPVLSKEERIQAYESIVPDEESSMECEGDLNAEDDEDQCIDEEIAYAVHDEDDDSVQDISLVMKNVDVEGTAIENSGDGSIRFASFEPAHDLASCTETGEMVVHYGGDIMVNDVAETVSCVQSELLDVTTTQFAVFESSAEVSKSTEETRTTLAPSSSDEPVLNVDTSEKLMTCKPTSVSDCLHNPPPPPPPPPPPGSKKKKSRRSKDFGSSIILPIPPPPEEKLNQWTKSKEKQTKYLNMSKSKSSDSANSWSVKCDSESRAISQDVSSSYDESTGSGNQSDDALPHRGLSSPDVTTRDDPVSLSFLAMETASILHDTFLLPIDQETVPSEGERFYSPSVPFVDETKLDDIEAHSTLSFPAEVIASCSSPAKVVGLSCDKTKSKVEASSFSEDHGLVVCTNESKRNDSVDCGRNDLEVGSASQNNPKEHIVIDLTNDPDLDVSNDPETIRRLWSTTSSNDPETLRRAFSVVSVSSTAAPDANVDETLCTPRTDMMNNHVVQGSSNERVEKTEIAQDMPNSFKSDENENVEPGDNGGDEPVEQDSSANHRQIFPVSGKSSFDAAIEVDPTILSSILNFLGDPVAVCRTKMLNTSCRKYVENNEHTLMRDAVRLGGMSMSVRPSFWLWVVLCKGSTPASTSLADLDNDQVSDQATLNRDFSGLERHGREGKWHHVIERDVSRAFGTLPPHKTGARLRTDSIVRALVSWGRSRLVGRGVKGNRDDRSNVRGDESTHSDDVSISPTDTVSDWGGVTPVGSFNGSFTSSQSDPMTQGAEGGNNPSKSSSKKKKKKSVKQNLSTEEEYALGANMLTDDMKASLQGKLSFILHALAAANPEVGYCQGMDYLVAHLLRMLQDTIRWKAVHGNLPAIVQSSALLSSVSASNDEALTEAYAQVDQSLVVEETIFLVMDSFLTSYGLQHFYWPELRCLKTCCRVFEKIIQMKLPVLADHFEHHELNVGLFALGWFQTLFLYLPSMPSATVCHMWDIWLVERSFKIFFRVGTAILFLSQPILLNHELEGMMGYLNTFPDATLLSPDILIACSLQIKITNRMLMELEQEVKDFPLTC